MAKDLKDMIDGIESSEEKVSKLEEKVTRLTELVQRQKKLLSDQEQMIEVYKEKVSSDMDIPPDIIKLKEIIGTQRAQLKEKDMEIEHLKGTNAQIEKELEMYQQQSKPLEERYSESFGTIGELKAEIITKEERVKDYEAKVKELKVFSDKLKEDYKNEIKEMRRNYQEEINDLKTKIHEMESFLLSNELISTEKSLEAKDFKASFQDVKKKYDEFIHKIEVLSNENREKEAKINQLKQDTQSLREFRDGNIDKIDQYKNLKVLMEGEPLFKAFLIIKDVGGKGLSLEDLKRALGSPIVMVKKFVQTLQDHQLIEENENGRLVVKKI